MIETKRNRRNKTAFKPGLFYCNCDFAIVSHDGKKCSNCSSKLGTKHGKRQNTTHAEDLHIELGDY